MASLPEPELFRALGALSETPCPELEGIADLLGLGPLPGRAAHGELFLFQLYPYASVYLGAEGMMGGEAADRIAGFWRALGQVPPAEPDHLAVMLGLQARLGDLERQAPDGPARERWRHARRAFLWEHLLSWLPFFVIKLRDLGGQRDLARRALPAAAHAAHAADTADGAERPDANAARTAGPFHLRWADLLGQALQAEAAALLPAAPPGELPLHLRSAPGCLDPRRDGVEAFLGSLLAPVRSGLVLARADLARAAAELGLGLRAGERRLVLAALFEQAPAPVLDWLAREAAAWAGLPAAATGAPAKLASTARLAPMAPVALVAAFWQHRAASTERLLLDLLAEI